MGAYEYIRAISRKKNSDVGRYLQRLKAWEYRKQPRVHKLEGPSRPGKARQLGYKAKPGFVVYRTRIRKGGCKKKASNGKVYGKPANHGIFKMKPTKSLQAIAEARVGRRLPSLRVLASYWVAQDLKRKYYEVILVDSECKEILNDKSINWICRDTKKHRECRGLTPASKKSRGLGRGHKYNKTIGGSRRGCWKRRNTISLKRYR